MSESSLDKILRKHFKEPFIGPGNSARWKSTPPANYSEDYVNALWRSYYRDTKPRHESNVKTKQAADALKKFTSDFINQDDYKDLFIIEDDVLSYHISLNPVTTNSSIMNGIRRQFVTEDIADKPTLLDMHTWSNDEYTDSLIIRLWGSHRLTERDSAHELYIQGNSLAVNESYTLPTIDTFNLDNIKNEFIKQVNVIKNLSKLVKEYSQEQMNFIRLEKKIENDYREAMLDLKEKSHKYINKFIKKGEIINSNSNYTCED